MTGLMIFLAVYIIFTILGVIIRYIVLKSGELIEHDTLQRDVIMFSYIIALAIVKYLGV